jgi:hypothetical protein
VGSNPAGRASYFKRLDAKASSRFSFAWGLFLTTTFTRNNRLAVRRDLLIGNAVHRFHQL